MRARQRPAAGAQAAWTAESDPLRKAYVAEIEITFSLQPDAVLQQLQSGDGDMTYDVNHPASILQLLTATGVETPPDYTSAS